MLPRVTKGYKGLEGVTGDNKGLRKVTVGYGGLQGASKGN